MDALGRTFNVGAGTGDGVWVSLVDAAAVSFLCILAAGDTYTLHEAKDAAGTGDQALAQITNYYTTKVDGSTVWAQTTQAAASSITTTATTQGLAVFSIHAVALSDNYKYVKVTSTGAGLVIPILHDLVRQERPTLLAAPGV